MNNCKQEYNVEFEDTIVRSFYGRDTNYFNEGDIITLIVATKTSTRYMKRVTCGYCNNPALYVFQHSRACLYPYCSIMRCRYCRVTRSIHSLDPTYYGYKKAINVKYVIV